MIPAVIRLSLVLCLTLLTGIISFSQNLVPNGGFEDVLYCPNGSSGLIFAEPWFTPTNATPDLFNECATDLDFKVPNNYFGFQYAHSGAGYAGGFWRLMNFDYREYVACPLSQPLIAGHHYSVSFWVNLPDFYCGINQGGAYFSHDPIDQNNVDIIEVTPQIATLGNFLNDYENWVKISGCYEAEGGEQYITIGNFEATLNSPFDPTCNLSDKAYYFVDDVVVLDDDAYVLELGDPVYVCDEYVIAPNVPGAEYEWSDGSTGSTLTVTQTGLYSVTITNSCSSQSDELEVIVHVSNAVDLGPDELTICDGESYFIQLQPGTNEYEWQDGSTGSEYTITEPGVYQVMMNDGCEISSDQITITTDFPPPPVILAEDVTLCPGDFIDLDFDPSYGEYLWQDGTPSAFYTIFNPGQYSLTISNACGDFVDDLTVFSLAAPAFDLGPDTSVLCEGTSLSISLDPTLGDFFWQDGSELNSYLVQSPGFYAVTVSNECGSSSQQIVFESVDTLGMLDLGPDLHLCPGDSVILKPGIANANYVWQNLSTSDTLVVYNAGIFYVSISNICSTRSDTLVVFSDPAPPAINLPAQLPLCLGDSIILQTNVQGASFVWSDNSTADSLIVTVAGVYSIVASNSCGSALDTIRVVDAGPPPSVDLGADISFCPGESIFLSPVYNEVISWLWSDGSKTDTYAITGNQQISVIVTNECGVAYDTINSSLLPAPPPVDLGNDTSLCPNNSYLISLNIPGVIFEWSDGSINNEFLVNQPGHYAVTITNSCGTNADTIEIDQLPPAPTFNLGPDQSLCPGELITLDPGLNNVSYIWQDGSTGSAFNTTEAGLFTLMVSNSCGFFTDSMNIVISTDGPVVNLGPDMLACEGDIVTLQSDVIGVDYLWQDGSIGSSYMASSSGIYYLQVSNNCGVDVDSVNVNITGTPPGTELGPDTILCEGSSMVLSSTSDPGTILLWQDGSSLITFNVTASGLYSISESNHCGIHKDSVLVGFINTPLPINLGPDTTLCPGESILLNAPFPDFIIKWQDGSSGNFMLADKAQTYSLELSNACGIQLDSLRIEFDHHVPIVTLGPSQTLCDGDLIELDVMQNFSATYEWNTGSDFHQVSILNPGTYSVTVSALCIDVSDSIVIEQGNNCFISALYLPNVFSPNGDNINDFFGLFSSPDVQVTDLHGSIFDRWGNLVYSSEEINFSWDGRFHEEPMQPGVYAYVIVVDYLVSGQTNNTTLIGDLTLIR